MEDVEPAATVSGVVRTGGMTAPMMPGGWMIDRKEMEKTVDRCIGNGGCRGCLLVSDVDRCKEIDDMYGHEAADAVSARVRELLGDMFMLGDFAAVGGPERKNGGILCGIPDGVPGGGSDVSAAGCSDRDICTLWLPFAERSTASDIRRRVGIVNDRLLHPQNGIPPATVSVGVVFCEAGDDYKSLVKRAYKALYLVKESGRCGCEIA